MKGLYFLLALLGSAGLQAAQFPISLRAEAAVLINAETGTILFEKNHNEVRYPASITKIATAWYILEKFGHRLDELVTTTKEAIAYCPVHLKRSNSEKFPSHRLEHGATLMHLMPQEMLPARVLMYGLLLISANDAANALVEHFCGTNEKFMADLNQFLHEKGFKNTTFNNPHGLHHEQHKTTALEMAKITSMAFRNPLFREIVSTQTYEKPASNLQPAVTLRQFNRLIMPGKYHYSKAIGGKTGHTARAGFTLAAAAEHGGRTLVVVLLGCKEADDRYRDAKILFEAAFNEKKVIRTLLTAEHDRFQLPIKGAKQSLQAKMAADLKIGYYPAEEPQLKSVVEWVVSQLPIEEGQAVGQLVLYDNEGRRLAYQPLVALNRVEATFWKHCTTFFRRCATSKRTVPLLVMMFSISLTSLGILRVFKKRQL